MIDRVNPYDKDHDIGKAIVDTKEANSCSAVSLAIVTGKPYKKCNEYLRSYGRRYRSGMTLDGILEAMAGFTKYKVVDSPYTRQSRITISQFVNKHPKGKFYCLVRGHAIAIVDGVLYDHMDKPRRQITRAWRFYNEEDLEEINRC